MRYLHKEHNVTDWREVSREHLDGYLCWLHRHRTRQGTPLKTATLARWLSAVRSFFAWQHGRGDLLCNPAEHLTAPKQEYPLPRVLNESDIARLIEMPDTMTAIGVRDRALMEVLYATGLRHNEAYRLDLYDVDARARRLIIRLGKDGVIASSRLEIQH
jgi:integrase/recombinase XerD